MKRFESTAKRSTATDWLLRSCPRCQGDLYRDIYAKEDDVVCLQCGRSYSHAALLDRGDRDAAVPSGSGEGAEPPVPNKRVRPPSR